MASPCFTSYNGSGGYIDGNGTASFDSPRNGFSNIQLPAPTRSATPSRPALSSRLLSSFSTNAQPAATALGRKGSVLHSRAKSLANYVPRLNTSTEPILESTQAQQKPHPIFGDLFNGDSAPVRLGIPPSSPIKEESEFIMEYKPAFTERPSGGPRRQSAAQSQVNQQTPAPKAGGWFTRKPALPTLPSYASHPQDEIMAVDINTTLFPNGSADPLSPHAYNDLLINATNLLQRMQAAYKEKVDYISSIQPEIEAQQEEVEEAETRSRHLKLQLEDMSCRAAEQNETMQEMAIQLAEEKLKALEAQETTRSTVKLVRRSTDKSTDGDNEVTPRRWKRGSGGSHASDSGFESDIDYAESIKSGGVETPLSPLAMAITPVYDSHEWAFDTSNSRPALPRLSPRFSAAAYDYKPVGSDSPSVEHLRGENAALRRQMEEMQRTLQGCIDFVGTVKP
ncbi:hypothetical protein LTR08_004060 [Meristemomyces frigidus]|nr:hypothetical protein LTR08_004060 [Meristemomyces frigidus]